MDVIVKWAEHDWVEVFIGVQTHLGECLGCVSLGFGVAQSRRLSWHKPLDNNGLGPWIEDIITVLTLVVVGFEGLEGIQRVQFHRLVHQPSASTSNIFRSINFVKVQRFVVLVTVQRRSHTHLLLLIDNWNFNWWIFELVKHLVEHLNVSLLPRVKRPLLYFWKPFLDVLLSAQLWQQVDGSSFELFLVDFFDLGFPVFNPGFRQFGSRLGFVLGTPACWKQHCFLSH